jgi:hypothetical protein
LMLFKLIIAILAAIRVYWHSSNLNANRFGSF